MSQGTYAIGVDLGGTTVKSGLIAADGTIHAQLKLPSRADEGPAAVIGQVSKSIADILRDADGKSLAGIGIAAAGIIEKDGGVIKSPPNFRNWNNVPLGNEIEKKFKMRVEVENDANAAAIAESKFGAGKQYTDFLFVIWGTGVGGGIILDREIYRGPHGGAGEIGHISIDYNGPRCNCGSRGCVEAYIGQRYLSARTVERLKEHPQSKILQLVGGDVSKVEPIYISRAAHDGDQFAREILEEAGRLLGVALAGVMNTMDLRVSIIGGGISAAGDFVFEAIKNSVVAFVQAPLKPDIEVLPAQLGNSAGMLGAAGLVL